MLYKVFTRNITGTFTDHVKFYPLSQKSISWFPSCIVKYISQECHNFDFSYLHMEPEYGLIFKNISSLENLNLHAKDNIGPKSNQG